MKHDPRHLQLLAAIVECGSLSGGAERLGKSQPSVSRTLAYLERRSEQALFMPGRRPLQPTELGLALAKQGQAIEDAVRLASTVVDQFRSGRTGVLKVGGTPFFMDGVISPRIPEFHRQNPGLRIEQSYAYIDELIQKLQDGRLDIAICPINKRQVPEDFFFTPVMPGRNVIACRAQHPLLSQPGIRAEDVLRYPWIAPPEISPLYSDLKQVLTVLGAKNFGISFTGGTLGAILSVLVGSDTLTVLPKPVIDAQHRKIDVSALPFKIQHPVRDVGILSRRPLVRRSAAYRFSAFVQMVFEMQRRKVKRMHP